MSVLLNGGTSNFLRRDETIITGYPYAMAGFARPAGIAAGTTIILIDSAVDNIYSRLLTASGTLDAEVRVSASGTANQTGVATGAWNHIAGSWMNSTYRRAYVNGVGGTANTFTRSFLPLNRVSMGMLDRTSPTQAFGGSLAEYGVWNLTDWGADDTAREAAFAAAVLQMRAGKSPAFFPKGLVGYWPLVNNPSDASPNGRTLTEFGSPTYTDHPPGIIYPQGLVNGLGLWLECDEAAPSGNVTRLDSHGSNHAASVNTVASAAAPWGTAADFNAANSEYLSVTSNASVQTGDVDFTLALWANLELQAATHRLIVKGWGSGATTEAEFTFVANTTSGKVQFYPQKSGQSVETFAEVTVPNLAGNWHLFFAWHDATNNQIGVAVDDGSPGTAGWAHGLNVGSRPLTIGGTPFQNVYATGKIGRVGMWKPRILTADERTRLWNNGNGLSYSQLASSPLLLLRGGLTGGLST